MRRSPRQRGDNEDDLLPLLPIGRRGLPNCTLVEVPRSSLHRNKCRGNAFIFRGADLILQGVYPKSVRARSTPASAAIVARGNPLPLPTSMLLSSDEVKINA